MYRSGAIARPSTNAMGGLAATALLAAFLVAAPAPFPALPITWPAEPTSAPLQAGSEPVSVPIAFEPNVGQLGSGVDVAARAPGLSVLLGSARARFVMSAGEGVKAIDMTVVGGDRSVDVVGIHELPGTANHAIGDRPSAWRYGVPTYGGARYSGVYEGIDLEFYGSSSGIEFDFIVSPGRDPSTIRLAFPGTTSVAIDAGGRLVARSGTASLAWKAPLTYQIIDGERVVVPSAYRVRGDAIGFQVGHYDRSRELVIDPVLAYSTYLGGSEDDMGAGVAVDADGNAYVHGYTFSTNFPLKDPIQGVNGGSKDAFVTKIDPTGSTIVYSTYLGGSGEEKPRTIAVDQFGNAYAGGTSYSSNFPTTAGAYQTTFGGEQDATITKLDPTGQLLYSTYLGGKSGEGRTNIAVDADGNAYVGGFTFSTNFPTVNPIQRQTAGRADLYVSKLGPAGDTLLYSTYLGGVGNDTGRGIAVDSSGSAYIHGWVMSEDFPMVNALQPVFAGGLADTVVVKLAPDGGSLVYSTYLGGSDEDMPYLGQSIDVDSAGNAYVTGHTFSTDFPTVMPYQGTLSGGRDGYVAKVDATGSALAYSTYLGGAGEDHGVSIAVNDAGEAYAAGHTLSSDFPVSNAVQYTKNGRSDAFVTKFSATGDAVLYSTYLGGRGDEEAKGIAVDAAGEAYVTGLTASSDFILVGPAQATYGGREDAFLVKITTSSASEPNPDSTPPEVTMNKPSIDELLRTNEVAVSWVGSDDTGISRYDLYERIGTTGTPTVIQSSNTTLYKKTRPPGATYCFEVKAYDFAGNEATGGLRCVAIPVDDRDLGFAYSGATTQVTDDRSWGSTLTAMTGPGAASYTFTGRRVGVLFKRSPASGRAAVYLDGALVRNIDLFASSEGWRIYAFTTTVPYGSHALEVVWTGTKNSFSTGTDVFVDGISYIQ